MMEIHTDRGEHDYGIEVFLFEEFGSLIGTLVWYRLDGVSIRFGLFVIAECCCCQVGCFVAKVLQALCYEQLLNCFLLSN